MGECSPGVVLSSDMGARPPSLLPGTDGMGAFILLKPLNSSGARRGMPPIPGGCRIELRGGRKGGIIVVRGGRKASG